MKNATGNPDNAGFCTPPGNCLLGDGMMNLTVCQMCEYQYRGVVLTIVVGVVLMGVVIVGVVVVGVVIVSVVTVGVVVVGGLK